MERLAFSKLIGKWALLGVLVCAGGRVFAQEEMFSETFYSSIERQYGQLARKRIEGWEEMLLQFRLDPNMSDGRTSVLANDFFNQLPWLTDIEHWGVEDYWATPVEMLGSNGGDCEDFSIGKYFTLTQSGMDTAKIRITYVKALDYDQAHMVLAFYPTPGAEPLILDNINKTILPASQRKDLLPIYSFNGDGLWLAKSSKNSLSGKGLPKWIEVNKKMFKEQQLN